MLDVAATAEIGGEELRLSATPSPLISVYFQTSGSFELFVRMASAPIGIANRGKVNLSTKTVCRS